jgi:hypothetical protein
LPQFCYEGICWRWVVSFTPWLLYTPCKGPLVPIKQESDWALERVWTVWRRKKSLVIARSEAWFFSCPVRSLSTILTMLSWLCYNVCACNNKIFVGVPRDLATVPLVSWKICHSQFRTNLMLFCLSEFTVSRWNRA